MTAYNFEFYTNTPISSSEARAILQIPRETYEVFVEKGVLPRSVDLCFDRPGRFLAHNFWDLVRLGLLLEFRNSVGRGEVSLVQALDSLLDELASVLDCDPVQGMYQIGFDALRSQIFLEHMIGLLTQQSASGALRTFKRLWKQLETGVCRCVAEVPFRVVHPVSGSLRRSSKLADREIGRVVI